MAAILFAELGIIEGKPSWIDEARTCVESVGLQLNNFPSDFCMVLCAWDLIANGYQTTSFIGAVGQVISRDIIELLNSSYRPQALTRYEPAPDGLEAVPHVLVCDEERCRLPMRSANEILEYIAEETQW
jgi:uncharacterized protein YyaL (SSP411 family)